MNRNVRPEELRLWAVVASTVRPGPGRRQPAPPAESQTGAKAEPVSAAKPKPAPAAKPSVKPKPAPAPGADIEPGRKRRLVRERDPIGLALDLHGLDQDRARTHLIRFLAQAQRDGERAVLVITGKGTLGEGVIRRSVPDWLADPALRGVVAGWSQAHRRHGGEGALYVALKRRAS